MSAKQQPGLYGIENSNRDFKDQYYWGKNQFNSSFPVSLACYLRDKGIGANYIKINKNKEVLHENLEIGDLFGTKLPNKDLYFSFESRYEPFRSFVHDELETIDLVIKENESGQFIRPIEIKLTTLPDNTTDNLPEDRYGCELVIRSPTMRYMALSMAQNLKGNLEEIQEIFEPECLTIRNWDNPEEIKSRLPGMLSALETFVSKYCSLQIPLLMQPVWKTIGKSAQLAENCLDIFVWSDYALTRLFMESALDGDPNKISRQQRAAARLSRFLFEISRSKKVFQKPIYDGMSLGNQTDKEFAISGSKTNKYMRCDRLTKPCIKKDEIKNIILGGGQKWLSPERRFDAIIYFSTELFDV